MTNVLSSVQQIASHDARPRAIEFGRKSRYPNLMTTKQKVLRAVKALPADASYEDAMERLLFLSKVERGLKQADTGKTIAHEKVKQKLKRWLK
jgi:predicted transcriptional regulator